MDFRGKYFASMVNPIFMVIFWVSGTVGCMYWCMKSRFSVFVLNTSAVTYDVQILSNTETRKSFSLPRVLLLFCL